MFPWEIKMLDKIPEEKQGFSTSSYKIVKSVQIVIWSREGSWTSSKSERAIYKLPLSSVRYASRVE